MFGKVVFKEKVMKTQARAVVIGGGVVGVSMLYHLAPKC